MATAAELARFRVRAPEFASVSDDSVDNWLDAAGRQMTASKWGGVYTDAKADLAAHMMARTPGIGTGASALAAGPVSGRRSGQESVTFGSAAAPGNPADADLLTTVYGQRYLALRGTRAAAGTRVLTWR